MSKRAKRANRVKRGQGNVRQSEYGRWEAYISIKGERLSASFDKESDAWARIATWKADAVRGVLGVREPEARPEPITFGDLARLLRLHKTTTKRDRPWREGTVRWFDGHNKSVVFPAFKHRLAAEITTEELREFLDRQVGRPIRRPSNGRPSGRVVSAVTVMQYERLMRMVFAFGVRTGKLTTSPMAALEHLHVPDEDQKQERALRSPEICAILEATSGAARAFFTVLAFTGARQAEAFRMRWNWVDLDGRKLTVRIPKRGTAADNVLPLGPRVRAALLELGPGAPNDLVFPGFRRAGGCRKKGPGRDRQKMLTSMRRPLQDALKEAKVDPKGVGLHSFRRGFITILEQAERYAIVRALARHSRKGRDLTARYLYPEETELYQAVVRLEQRVMEAPRVLQLVTA